MEDQQEGNDWCLEHVLFLQLTSWSCRESPIHSVTKIDIGHVRICDSFLLIPFAKHEPRVVERHVPTWEASLNIYIYMAVKSINIRS